MREIPRHASQRGLAIASVLAALGLVSSANAGTSSPSAPEPPRRATPRALAPAAEGPVWELAYQQRRGRMAIPQRPVNVDSSPMVDILNKALKALNATDRDYDGHREKAINHVEAAIDKLQVPNANANAKGKNGGGDTKAGGGKASARAATAVASANTGTTPQDESDAAMRKAKATLFEAHHKLTDKASTKGRIHADADVRVAIDEVTAALKTSAAPPAAAPTAAPAAKTAAAPAAKPAAAPVAKPAAKPAVR